jgi:hypothetical protein
MTNQQNNEIEDGIVGLFKTFLILWRHKWIIIIFTFLCGIGSIAVVLQMEKIYRIEVLMKPLIDEKPSSGAFSFMDQAAGGGLGGLLGSKMPGQDTLAIMKTYQFLTPIVKNVIKLPVLFPETWDETTKSFLGAAEDVPTLRQGVNKVVNDILFIEKDIETGLVTLSIEWSDRETAIIWVNSIVDAINKYQKDKAVTDAESQKGFIINEMGKTQNTELKAMLTRLLSDQINKISLASTRKDFAFETLDPASMPDTTEAVRPKRALLVIFVTFLGGFLSLIGVLIFDRIQQYKKNTIKK